MRGTETGGYGISGRLRVGGPTFGVAEPAIVLQVDFGADQDDDRQRPAAVYTVTFGIEGPPLPGAAGGSVAFVHPNPVATIEYSTGGNSVRRQLSVVNGMSIAVVCDHLKVIVEDQSTSPDGTPPPGGTNITYLLTILATPGTRGGSRIPPFLAASPTRTDLAGGAAAEIPIPAQTGITSVCVFASGTGGPIPLCEQQFSSSATIATWIPQFPDFVPIVPQASKIRISNAGPALSNATFFVVFGIDG